MSAKSIWIKGGTVVTARRSFRADVLVEGEKIKRVGKMKSAPTGAEIIDATGCLILPGGVDAHTHMDLPLRETSSSDTFETGTAAALAGGTTTIIDFANQSKGHAIRDALRLWHDKADGKALCDYGFHVSVTDYNAETRREIEECVRNEGVTSFKVFTAYKGALMIDDRQMFELMQQVAALGGLVTVHAENGDLIESLVARHRAAGELAPRYHVLSRPVLAEAEATGRVVDLAQEAGCPLYVVHMTSGEALERALAGRGSARRWKRRQAPVFVETCPQYLLLDQKLYFADGFDGARVVMSPPLRKRADREALWAGLKKGSVQVVATDHCPFFLQQKDLGREDFTRIPNGIPGVENRLELLYSEGVVKRRLPLTRFVDALSTAPAKLFGLYPRKGTIAPGSDADLVIFDPKARHRLSAGTQHMNTDYSVYEGWRVRGRVRETIHRGQVAFRAGKVLVAAGYGRYLKRDKPDFS